MGETNRQKTLQQIARAGRAEHQARVMTPPRALRLALARAADELFDLPLSVSSVQLSQVSQENTIAAFDEDALLMVFDGPMGAIGAVSVAVPLLAGLIEVQTMGAVLDRAPDEREPTQTDAALAAPLLNRCLEGFVDNFEGEGEADWAKGFRFGAMIEGTRMFSLLLEAADFHLFRVQVSLNSGAKEGEIVIALPVVVEVASDPPEPSTGQSTKSQVGHGARLKLGQSALMSAEAPMVAVLDRIKMPLSGVSGLKAGDLLHVPRDALSNTRLMAQQTQSDIKCRLGQVNGFRAVRLIIEGGGPSLIADSVAESDADLVGTPHAPVQELHPVPGGLPGELAPLSDIEGDPLPDASSDLEGEAGLDGMPALSEMGDLPDLPELGDLGGDLSDLPDLPPVEGLGDLPDLADLPELALDE